MWRKGTSGSLALGYWRGIMLIQTPGSRKSRHRFRDVSHFFESFHRVDDASRLEAEMKLVKFNVCMVLIHELNGASPVDL
jgi:hypothetical protein